MILSSDTLYKVNKTDLNKIQYHVKRCYVHYKKAGERSEKKALGKCSHRETFPCSQVKSPEGRTRLNIKDQIFDFKSKIGIKPKTL